MFHTIVSIKNDGHYFCRAGGNRPDGLNEPVTTESHLDTIQRATETRLSVSQAAEQLAADISRDEAYSTE
ncbi:TPA: hypothetical protein HMK19_17580 [Escherichia coli]|nr:hypothetical protein [Escherichia coli]HAG9044867.1 hypothetical protein [Escherichia coli]HAJ1781064.1 hypothetical protein [Escherichia coli]HAJ1830293.1 hypothetical protein [Escherichia coli]HAJ3290329.1 hypothetical protein [Escherichia coli]